VWVCEVGEASAAPCPTGPVDNLIVAGSRNLLCQRVDVNAGTQHNGGAQEGGRTHLLQPRQDHQRLRQINRTGQARQRRKNGEDDPRGHQHGAGNRDTSTAGASGEGTSGGGAKWVADGDGSEAIH